MLTLIFLVVVLFLKDKNSGMHSIRVAFKMASYAMLVKDLFDISIIRAFLYGLFHDVGKIDIPNKILKKKDRLTEEEFAIIKTHVSNRYALLAEKHFPGICDHHETMNGNGYMGKKENEINVYAKLLSIADVYDALSNKRIYKDAMESSEVLTIMDDMVSNGKFCKELYNRVVQVV